MMERALVHHVVQVFKRILHMMLVYNVPRVRTPMIMDLVSLALQEL